MRRWILVLIILSGVIISAGCTGPQEPVKPQIPEKTATPAITIVPSEIASIATPLSQASVSDNTVTIRDFAFTPQTIEVRKGAIVRWENLDSVPHRIMFTDPAGRDNNIESGVLAPHQSFSRKFDAQGTYPYYCKIHTGMKGTVVVT